MKMKLLFGILFICLMVTSVMAMSVPHPIAGRITSDGFSVQGLEVKVKNLATSAQGITTTNNKGFYQVDLGNIDSRYNEGDNIKICLNYCQTFERCCQTTVVSGGGNKVSFDVTKEVLPSSASIIKIICPDGSTVTESSLCPVEDEIDWAIVAAITIVIVGLGLAWAWATNNGVRSQWKWMPGMAGILKYHLKRYKELCKLGKKAEAKKKAATLLKYSQTITEKYLNNLLE